MRCMRDITNIKWYYRVSNVSIRRKILVRCIAFDLRIRRLKWFGHVSRVGKERLPHQLLFGELEARKRPQSKPPKRWKDCIKDDLQKFQIQSGTRMCETQDCVKWTKKIQDGLKFYNTARRNHECGMESTKSGISPHVCKVSIPI